MKRTKLEKLRLDIEDTYDYIYMNIGDLENDKVLEVVRKFGKMRFEEGRLSIGEELGKPQLIQEPTV